MQNQINPIKDSEGNNHIFDDSSINDDIEIGDNLSDFEILQILSEKSNCVSKVRSLKNYKIYAMKEIKLNSFENSNRQKYIDKVNKLKEINSSYILKYYNSFIDNDNLYLIMEYMENSDILSFIKKYQALNKSIEEPIIWNLLLQCLSALENLYKQNFVNSSFRINNIFLDNEQNVRLSIFVEYNKINNEGDDINLLGKFFYSMCFSQNKRVTNVESLRNVVTIKDNNDKYSNELIEIIYKMLDDKEYKSLSLLYEQFKNEFSKKYDKNTSIESVCRCLYSFKSLDSSILKKEEVFKKCIDKYYISHWFLKTIKALSGTDEYYLISCFKEFRMAIALENSKLDGEEIDPLYLLSFLLMKMHFETKAKNEINMNCHNRMGNNFINSKLNEEDDKTNSVEVLKKYVSYYKSNIKSLISELFFGFGRTKRICFICKTGNYYFGNFCLINFELSTKNNENDFDLINDGFKVNYLNKKELNPDTPERVFCERCLNYQKHTEINEYYMIGHHLIISFIRGKDYKNEKKINFNEEINLKDYVASEGSPIDFYITGSINRIYRDGKEEFIYYYRDPLDYNIWYTNGMNKKYHSAPIEEIKGNGQIILLFYNNSKLKP